VTPQTDAFFQSTLNPASGRASLVGRAAVGLTLAWPFIFFLLFFIAGLGAGVLFALRVGLYGATVGLLLFTGFAAAVRIAQMGASLLDVRAHKLRRRVGLEWTLPPSPRVLPVSILVWIHNRADVITDRIERLLAQEYPSFEIIVVNDGSTDATHEILQSAFDLRPVQRVMRRVLPTLAQGRLYVSARHPNLTVVNKPATGRYDSLNYAVNLSRFPLICPVDADLIPDSQALAKLTRGFIENPAHTVAVSGLAGFPDDPALETPRIRLSSSTFASVAPVAEPPTFTSSGSQIAVENGTLNDLQRIERILAFHACWLLRVGVGNIALTPGVLSLVKKSSIPPSGGFRPLTDEDTLDLLLDIYGAEDREPNAIRRVVFLPDALARIAPLDTLQAAARARLNAQKRTLEIVTRHFPLTFGGQGGWESRLALPAFAFASLFAPSLELIAIGFTVAATGGGALSLGEGLIALFGMLTLALLDAAGGVLCDEFSGRGNRSADEIVRLLRTAVRHAFGYRWAMTFAQTRGTLAYIFGR
jgi:poly-beta-1,6-N-acetyl-D-glucosamine synthase